MSKNFLTQKQALSKVGSSTSGGTGEFTSKLWMSFRSEFDQSKLSKYGTYDYVINDDITKGTRDITIRISKVLWGYGSGITYNTNSSAIVYLGINLHTTTTSGSQTYDTNKFSSSGRIGTNMACTQTITIPTDRFITGIQFVWVSVKYPTTGNTWSLNCTHSGTSSSNQKYTQESFLRDVSSVSTSISNITSEGNSGYRYGGIFTLATLDYVNSSTTNFRDGFTIFQNINSNRTSNFDGTINELSIMLTK